MKRLQDRAWATCEVSKRWARLRTMQNIVRTIAILAMLLASTASPACVESFVDSVKANPQRAVEGSAAIVAGRATSIQTEQGDAVIVRLETETVFKGQAPRVLVFRARYI